MMMVSNKRGRVREAVKGMFVRIIHRFPNSW